MTWSFFSFLFFFYTTKSGKFDRQNKRVVFFFFFSIKLNLVYLRFYMVRQRQTNKNTNTKGSSQHFQIVVKKKKKNIQDFSYYCKKKKKQLIGSRRDAVYTLTLCLFKLLVSSNTKNQRPCCCYSICVLYILMFGFWTSRPHVYLQDVAVWSFIGASVRGGHFSRTSWHIKQRGYSPSAALHVPRGADGAKKVTTHTLLPHRYQVSTADHLQGWK